MEFDIITAAIQFPMRDVQRFAGFASRLLVALAVLAGQPAVARAADIPAVPPPAPEQFDDAGTTQAEVLEALRDVQTKFGSDAVLLEGHLLGYAIRSGSVLEAKISVPGLQEREGKQFLAFNLETGIVYNDREIAASARVVRIWADIIEATLHRFHTLTLTADGIVLLVGYAHKSYADEADLRAHLDEGRGTLELAAFYLPLADVRELLAEHITGQQLADRATITVDGEPTRLLLPTPEPTPLPTHE